MSKKQTLVTNITYQIDDEILKTLLDKISELSSRVLTLESQIQILDCNTRHIHPSYTPDGYAQ